MHHLKRLLWLSAWGVWLLLGFGLYRELPRKLGDRTANLKLRPGVDYGLGFIGDTSRYVVAKSLAADGPSILRASRSAGTAVEVYDVESGSRLQFMPSPEFHTVDWESFRFAPRSGVVFVTCRATIFSGRSNQDYEGLNIIDPVDGKWRNIGRGAMHEPILHRDRPWVAFVEPSPLWRQPPQVVVYDFVAKKRTMVWKERQDAKLADRPFFIPDSSTFVVPIRSPERHKTLDDLDFELWDLDAGPSLKRTSKGFRVGDRASVAANGRVAFGSHDPDSIHVYGIQEEKLLFSNVPQPVRPVGQSGPLSQPIGVEISRDGRTVLGSATGQWSIDEGRQIWKPRPFEYASGASDGEQMIVSENWGELWMRWLPNFRYITYAIRRLDSHELVCRVEGRQYISGFSRDRVVAMDGSVYRMPYLVNYPLLALCQSILALPPVLLWAALRWRRRRAARRQPAVLFESN
jgi:hypothetical protein